MNIFSFETKRLYVKPIDLDCILDMYNICSNKNVTRYLTFKPHTNISQTKNVILNMIDAYLHNSSYNYAIYLKENNTFIGSCSLTFKNDYKCIEIGYLLDEKYWNQGYMSELMPKLIEISFNDYHVDYCLAKHIYENYASKRIIEKNHFKLINNQETFYKNYHFYQILTYVLTRQDYENL